MKAGTLEIEILASVARLQEDMRQIERVVGKTTGTIAGQAKTANNNLRSVGKGASAGVQEYSREVARLKAMLEPTWAALSQYKQQINLLRDAHKQGAITQQQYAQQVRLAKAAYQESSAGVVGASNAQRMGMSQLAMQIGDVSTMYALGARPAQIFASQIGQVTQAVQMMTGGTSRLARFLGGPWGIAVIVAVQALGPLIGKLFEAEDAAKKVEFASYALGDAQSILGQVMDLTTGKINTQSQALLALAQAQAVAGQVEARRQMASAQGAMTDLQRPTVSLQGGMGGGISLKNELGWQADVISAYRDGTLSIAEAERGLRSLMDTGMITKEVYLDAAKAVTDFGVNAENLKIFEDLQKALGGDAGAAKQFLNLPDPKKTGTRTDRRAETLQREAEATEALITGLGTLADAYLESDAAAMKAEITAKATEQGIRKRADLSEYVARQMRLAVAERTADAAKEIAALRAQNDAQALLNQRIAQGGMEYEDAAQLMKDEAALRPYLTAQAMAEGEAKDRLAGIIAQLRGEQERSNKQLALTKALQDASNYEKQVLEPLRREAQVLEMVGWARDKALLQMQRETELKPLLTKLTDALAKGELELVAAIQKQIDLINERYGLEIQTGDRSEVNRRAQEELDLYNATLRDTIGLLQRLGSFGEVLGGLLGVVSGNAEGIRGPIGDLLNIKTGQRFDEKTQRTVGVTLADELRTIFKLDGEFGKTMTSLLHGAGTGTIAGTALFGKQSNAGQLGSAIGGALGQQFGEKVLGKGLESIMKGLGGAAGPLGAIAGGIIGGLVGGLFTKAKWGSVSLSSAGVSGAAGNSGASQRAAVQSGDSFTDALQQIADAFGGAIGGFGNITLGVRKGDWRVNAGGTSLKKKKGATDFGEDAEAAIAYAIQIAIERGAITGIRASTQNLLRASGDLQARLDKALKFEAVFKELASLKNPLQFTLDELTRQFDQLRKIFAEAGASAEEYAQLEELLQLKREDAIERARRDALDKIREQRDLEIRILELLGREEDALAAAREMELAGLKEALRPLQSMIYTLEDARAIMAQFEPLASDLRTFKQELLSTRGADTFGAVAARFREVAQLSKNGDAEALGKLRDTASEFLDAAKANAASELDYRRAVGQVLGAVDDGIFAADSQIEYAQMQIDAIAAQSDILASIRDKLDAQQAVIADNTAKTVQLLQRFEGDGLRVKTDADTPLLVSVL